MVHLKKEPVRFVFEGPLPERDLPEQVLYDVHLRFCHEAGPTIVDELVQRMQSIAGEGKRSKIPLGARRVRWDHDRYPMRARIHNGTVEIRLTQRLKGKALTKLVGALAGVPGAHDLTIEAQATGFGQPFDDVRPCSPCAAKTFPRL